MFCLSVLNLHYIPQYCPVLSRPVLPSSILLTSASFIWACSALSTFTFTPVLPCPVLPCPFLYCPLPTHLGVFCLNVLSPQHLHSALHRSQKQGLSLCELGLLVHELASVAHRCKTAIMRGR